MKKSIILLLALCLAVAISACAEGDMQNQPVVEAPAPTETPIMMPPVIEASKPLFDGKIAIISEYGGVGSYSHEGASQVARNYDKDKVLHVTWPVNYMQEQERVIEVITKLGADPDIKAIIVNLAIPGVNDGFDKLSGKREDIFVVYIDPQENTAAMAHTADILLSVDELGVGPAMVRQAQKLGAKTFVHYSFSHYNASLDVRRDLIRKTCEDIGIEFVDVTALDPNSKDGVIGAQQFILDDVPKMVAKYGKDTAFFTALCVLQVPLINAIVDTGAIYPQPCCPSPYHGLITALYPEYYADNDQVILPVQDIIAKERAALAEKNMLGRVSTWPDLSSTVLTYAAAEYAIKWINGEVPKEGVDVTVLKQLMEDYAGVEVYLTPYKDEYPYTENGTGETYENFLLMRMDYITY